MQRYPVIPVAIERHAQPIDERSLAQARLDALMLEWSFPNFWPDASDKAKQFYNKVFKPPAPAPAPPPPQPQPPPPPTAWSQPAMPSPSGPQSFEELLHYVQEVHDVTGQILALMRAMAQPAPETQQQKQQTRICVARAQQSPG